jgi:hypothetical protein
MLPMAQISSIASSICNTVVLTSEANGPGKNNGLLYACAPSGTKKIQRSNNNKNSRSQAFQATDQTVVNLDREYDGLPDQGSWIDYAASIEGQWQPCVNCELETSPKKLFRQLNLYRQLIRMNVVETVPVGATSTNMLPQLIILGDYAPPVGPWIQLFASPADMNSYWTCNVGRGLQNPTCFVPSDQIGVEQLAGPIYDFGRLVISLMGIRPTPPSVPGGKVRTCTFLGDGSPGQSTIIDLEWQQ